MKPLETNSPTSANLLLVDDDRLILATLATGLRNRGYSVNTAESVEEAETILATGERPDLVILDVSLSGRSGLELASQLNQHTAIPFILLSAYSDTQFITNSSDYGALAYVVKPIDITQLVPTINAALAHAEALRVSREG